MHRLFGRKKPAEEAKEAPTLQDVAKTMATTDGDFEMKINSLNTQLRDISAKVKRATGATKNRLLEQARLLMSRRNIYEKNRTNNANQLFNIDQVAFQIVQVQNTQASVAAMGMANQTLQQEVAKLDIDKMEDLQADLEDMMFDMEEMNEWYVLSIWRFYYAYTMRLACTTLLSLSLPTLLTNTTVPPHHHTTTH
jgi:hypothetical protein